MKELNLALSLLEEKYGKVDEVLRTVEADCSSCDKCTGAMFGDDRCERCKGGMFG